MKFKKSALLLVLLLSLALGYSSDKKFIGSKKSDKYHYLSCKWAARIKRDNAVYFESVKEAKTKGYVPCKVCRPPAE